MGMTISRLAASADVNVETVRYYQRIGLLPEPPRPLGGIRHYGASEVARLQFIRRAKAMGFTLGEITGLLEIRGKRSCERTRKLTEHKLADVRQRIVELQQLERDLASLVTECQRVSVDAECPTLGLLGRAEGTSTSKPSAARKTGLRMSNR